MALVLASAAGGALAVSWHPLATALAAALGGLAATLALAVERWAGLPARRQRATLAGDHATWRGGRWFLIGLGIGLLLLGCLRLLIEPLVLAAGARIAGATALPLWQRALIIYSAAVGEELLFRLLLLSLVAGVLARVLRRRPAWPDRGGAPDGQLDRGARVRRCSPAGVERDWRPVVGYVGDGTGPQRDGRTGVRPRVHQARYPGRHLRPRRSRLRDPDPRSHDSRSDYRCRDDWHRLGARWLLTVTLPISYGAVPPSALPAPTFSKGLRSVGFDGKEYLAGSWLCLALPK